MKQRDVKEGGTYLTLVSGRLMRVVVVRSEIHSRYSHASMKETTRVLFRVQTEDGKPLPKLRTAAGLRALPTGYEVAVFCEGAEAPERVVRVLTKEAADGLAATARRQIVERGWRKRVEVREAS